MTWPKMPPPKSDPPSSPAERIERERSGFPPRGPMGAHDAGPFGPRRLNRCEVWGHEPRGTFFREGPSRYVRARLHRRIFAWFGASILLTGFALFALHIFIDRATNFGYRREMERANTFVSGQFERIWDKPDERNALAHAIERDFEARVELRDASGAAIEPFNQKCGRPKYSATVTRQGSPLGEVHVCVDAYRSSARWVGFSIFTACLILWAASGRIAKRLARPLGELARVAGDLGRGRLDSRVEVGCYAPDEVGVVGEAMNDMAGRIQKQLKDQRELLATVSHELRTPLSRIRLLTEIARDGGDPGHAFDEIDREVVEIDQLVGDLLASSRLEFSALTTKEVSAQEAAERALTRAGIDPANVLVVAPSDVCLTVHSDPTLLARALSNLLDNAARHGGGATRVTVRPVGTAISFEVEDHGPGLAEGEEDRIFEPFYQGPTSGDSAPKKGALGLGLALVRRIAEAHGGRAYAENRDEGGARIVFELPKDGPPQPSVRSAAVSSA